MYASIYTQQNQEKKEIGTHKGLEFQQTEKIDAMMHQVSRQI
jgi:hypothetical protein